MRQCGEVVDLGGRGGSRVAGPWCWSRLGSGYGVFVFGEKAPEGGELVVCQSGVRCELVE